jgi:transcriptional regulator with XRE-family HTH domain
MGNRRPKPQRLAAKLLAIRRHLGVSQTNMVKLLESDKLTCARISEWECGSREPNLLLLLSYARLAKVPVESMIDDNLDLPV